MGVRFTERGLEKFCQRGYAIIPDIIAGLPTFDIPEISFNGLRISLSNLRVRTIRVSTMKVRFRENNYVTMEAKNGLMQMSTRLKATLLFVTGTVDCVFTLKGFGSDISLKLGDDPDCPYHFFLGDISNKVYLDALDMDLTGLDLGGDTIANLLQGMSSTLEPLLKDVVLGALFNTVFLAIKQSMSNLPLLTYDDIYSTDQRYINGINIIDNKIVANQDGSSYLFKDSRTELLPVYPASAFIPPPRNIYTDREYELFFDREAINSYLYTRYFPYRYLDLRDLSIPYAKVKTANIAGLKKALITAGLLRDANDAGSDVKLFLTTTNIEAYVPWLGAAGMPANFSGSFVVTACKGSNTPVTIINVDGSAEFSAGLHLRKTTYGFNNDQLRAYVELLSLTNIEITKSTDGVMDNPIPLLQYFLPELYMPGVKNFLFDPGMVLMNGNFVNMTTVVPIYFVQDEKVVFVADIENNNFFA